MTLLFNLLLLLCITTMTANAAVPQFLFPRTALAPENLAVIINDDDPLSRQIAEYYQSRRHIPEANMIHVSFTSGGTVMSAEEFIRIKTEVDGMIKPQVQALAITWAAPYRVDCMSITAAFAFGYNRSYCSVRQCAPTRASPYFNSPSVVPHSELKMLPTMALAGTNLKNVEALIDRGIAADGTYPAGTGYLVSTSDKQRNVRAANFRNLVQKTRHLVRMKLVENDYIKDKKDLLFYFTGSMNVSALGTLHFLPGAIADHLTSFGGQLTDSKQMSSLRWLEAGATGSYGTVVEPCNMLAKFPDPALATYWYLQGNSLIEAYWKSVQFPGEGIFIGEPLANPYGGFHVSVGFSWITIRTQSLAPGTYALQGSNFIVGPYIAEAGVADVHFGMNELHFSNPGSPYYRLIRVR